MRPVLKGSSPWKRVRRRQEKNGVRIKQKAEQHKENEEKKLQLTQDSLH